MPSLADVAIVLGENQGRYEYLDAFVDDIDDFADPRRAALRLASQPRPAAEVWVDGRLLQIEVFRDQGVARFRLLPATSPPPRGEGTALGAALGGVLGAAAGAAAEQKEGLLGGLVLGVLLGGIVGAATSRPRVERAMALAFDRDSSAWKVYDGPLLRWAKNTLAQPLA